MLLVGIAQLNRRLAHHLSKNLSITQQTLPPDRSDRQQVLPRMVVKNVLRERAE